MKVALLPSICCCLAIFAGLAPRAWSADVVVGEPFWPSAQATAHIIAQGLERELGVTTEVKASGTLGIFVGIDRGEIHVHPEIWLPNLEAVVRKYADERRTLRLSPQAGSGSQNICVTRATAEATGVARVTDLADKAMAAKFDSDGDGRGEMWIGAETWSSTIIEEVRAKSYGYADTMSLLKMPEDVAMAAVDAAAAVGRPIVFYCYAPHHVFKLHDIVVLDERAHDPAAWSIVMPEDDSDWLAKSKAASAWDDSHFHVGYAASLAAERPKVARFLEKVSFTTEEIVDMSYALGIERQSPQDYAARWLAVNHARVREWAR